MKSIDVTDIASIQFGQLTQRLHTSFHCDKEIWTIVTTIQLADGRRRVSTHAFDPDEVVGKPMDLLYWKILNFALADLLDAIEQGASMGGADQPIWVPEAAQRPLTHDKED